MTKEDYVEEIRIGGMLKKKPENSFLLLNLDFFKRKNVEKIKLFF
jgi:hypothetical protein